MMTQEPQNVRIRIDRYTQVCLTMLVVLLTLTVIGLWAEKAPGLPEANARSVSAKDTGSSTRAHQTVSSRAEMLVEQRKVNASLVETNAQLRQLVNLFKSGDAKVRVAAEEAKDAGRK